MKKISVSIIVPVYNVELYIYRCLESIESQDYLGPMECIIVDDCSTDRSFDMVKSFIGNHSASRITYILKKHDSNLGVSVARNTALKYALGDYVYYLDSDDYLPNNSISLLVSQSKKYPGVDMVMGQSEDSDSDKLSYNDIDIYKKNQYVHDPKWIQYAFLRYKVEFNITVWDKLVRRELLIDNNISFLPGITIHEDNHWLYQVLNCIHSMAFVFETTYIRYNNIQSATHTIDRLTERNNWHRIIYEYSRTIFNPLRKLKLGRFMVKYYYDRLYELDYSKDQVIRFNFMKQALLCKEYKVCIMLFATLLFPRYCMKKDLNEHLKQHAYRLFVGESEKNEYIL